MHNNNERLHGDVTFSFTVTLDDVDAETFALLGDLQRTFGRALSANERFLPQGVELGTLQCDDVDIYAKNDEDRRMDYLMATDPNV